jgi:hypothetical protein
MNNKEALRQRQEQLLTHRDDAEGELSALRGVLGVGIGLKEVSSEATDQVCFRVWVIDKLPVDNLASGEVIPSEVFGFPTDVVKIRAFSPSIHRARLPD